MCSSHHIVRYRRLHTNLVQNGVYTLLEGQGVCEVRSYCNQYIKHNAFTCFYLFLNKFLWCTNKFLLVHLTIDII